MKQMAKLIFMCLSFFSLSCVYALNTAIENSPVGFWKTIDDVTHKPKAIVQIWEAPNKKLLGRILKIYPRPGADQNERCIACEGVKHNQRIIGMAILEKLAQNKDNLREWNGGNILDPKNGKTYSCNIQLVENGQKLNVRGYIGMPLFGRSQTWLRTSDLSMG